MLKKLLLLIPAVFIRLSLSGQIEVSMGEPLFPVLTSFYDIGIDQQQVEEWKLIDQPKNQPFRFAIPSALNLSPDNSGVTFYQDGETVWVIGLSSKGALSLNLQFEPFNLSQGSYVYVYDYQRRVIRGAFTSESAAGNKILPVLPVPGDSMIIECHFPGKSIPEGSIAISQASHDFLGFFGAAGAKDENYGTSESCEVDILCSDDESQLLASRAVCRLLISGQYLCTGTLINCASSEKKAYLLTANHCIANASEAASTICVFNYMSPWCDGPDHRISHSISGSALKATNDKIDFSLLQLSSFPPLVFEPYFAGWDITGTTPSNTFVVHHPSGDVMKVSVDNNAPVISSYPESSYGYITSGFWRILRWDSGTTEGGSSGSALFDQNFRIKGTLTGGEADCASPVNDYFARIDKMFSISSNEAEALKPWLDPYSSGVTQLNGYDPYLTNFKESDTLYNIPETSSLKSEVLSSPGYGYITGINSDSLISYAEYFDFTGTGEIASVIISIAEASYLTNGDTARIFIFSSGDTPGKILASKKVMLPEVKNNYEFKVDFDRTVPVSEPFYVGYRLYYKGTISSPQTQFAPFHSEPYASNSQNTAWFNDGSGWYPFTLHPYLPAPVSLAVKTVIVDNSIPDSIDYTYIPGPGLTACPNPFSDHVTFLTNDTIAEAKLIIYDHSGKMVFSKMYNNPFPGGLKVDLPFLARGIYHYIFWNGSIIFSGTIIKAQ